MLRRWLVWAFLLSGCGGAALAPQAPPTGQNSTARDSASPNSEPTGAVSAPASAATRDPATPEPGSAKAAPGEQRLFLFEVAHDGLPVSYLHGSAHVLRPEDATPHPEVDRAFAACDALVVEVDVTRVEPALLQGLTLQLGALPADDDLQAHVSAETWQALVDTLPSFGLPLSGVRRMRPWFVSMTLAALMVQREGYHPEFGVDRTYLGRAHAEGRHQVLELETADSQLRMMAGLSDEIQDLMLADTLVQTETTHMADLFRAWKAGDLEALSAIMFDPLHKEPRLAPMYEALFQRRNRDMADRIDTWLRQRRHLFVVVGAGHLVGPQGIPALLASRGYRVRQVTAASVSASVSPSVSRSVSPSALDGQDQVGLGAP